MSQTPVLLLTMGILSVAQHNNTASMAGEKTVESSGRLDNGKLRTHLLKHYDRTTVPLDTHGRGINATVYMWPYDILDVVFVLFLKSVAYLTRFRTKPPVPSRSARWRDPYLQWDPDQFGGVSEIFIARNQIWLPEIDIFYSKDGSGVADRCKDCPVRVTSDGQVLRGYYFSYSFPCHMNVKYFPFDYHNCTLELANWHLDQRMMDLYADNATVDLSIFLDNAEWELLAMTAARKVDYYNYGLFPILRYVMFIKRKPFYYVTNLVVPTVILTVTALIGYHMPSGGNGMHQEKVKMGLTTILSIYILQLGVSDKLPRTSDVIPLLTVFYSCMVGLLSMAIVATSFVILVEKQGVYGKPPPQWVVRLLLRQQTIPSSPNHYTTCSTLLRPHSHCRRLDCGCRLRKRPSTRYQELINVASPAMRNRRGCLSIIEQPDDTTGVVTLQVLSEVRTLLHQLEKLMGDQRASKKIKEQWARLADVIENLSLCAFLLGIIISIQLFLHHGWY